LGYYGDIRKGEMMSKAKQYWDDYYKSLEGKLPQVNSFLELMSERLQKGRVLDVAMGSGQNSIFLAEKGFQTVGFDISPIAISAAMQAAELKKVKIEAKQVDLDYFLMQPMEYDSIIMTRFKPALTRFFPEMIKGLKQGGTILVESLGLSSMPEALSKEDAYRDYYFNSNEILKSLEGLTILFYQETHLNGQSVVQCLAKKPLDKDAVKYDLFGMHSKTDKVDKPSRQLELAEQLFKK
jgi:SAM-dependent methyltransferase